MIILKLSSHKDIGAKSATGNTTGNNDWCRSGNLENNRRAGANLNKEIVMADKMVPLNTAV